jgi:hypothetical protein
MKKRVVLIKGGRIHFIYDDAMRPLMDQGKTEVRRASYVEPINTPVGVKWQADMSPVGGPVLGPFDLRQQALDREIEWLNEHSLGIA